MTGHARSTTWLAGLAAAALLLTGCSDDAEPSGDASSATSTASSEPDKVPSSEPTVQTSDGGEVVTSGELSEDFPEKKVPVVAGKVLSSATSPDTGYNVVILADGKPKKVSKKAVKLLKAEGFTVKSSTPSPGAVVTVLRSPDFKVEIAATASGPQTSINYFILKR